MRHPLWAAAVLLPACSTYDQRYQFEPAPLETEVRAADGPVLARGLAAVVGLRRADSEVALPQGVEVRLRAENPGSRPLTLEASGAQLFTGDLQPFPPPLVDPPGDPEIAPGGVTECRLLFPLPANARDLNLEGLGLRWAVRLDGVSSAATASFSRRPRPVYDDYPYYPWGYLHPIGYPYWWTRQPHWCPLAPSGARTSGSRPHR